LTERTGHGEADELDSVDMESIDWKIGHMSGVALAKTDASLTDEQVVAEGIEAFDHFTFSVVLSRSLFLAGHLQGYRTWLGGLV